MASAMNATSEKYNSDNLIIQNLEYLVIDSGAIIRGHSYTLSNHTKRVCTIQEVINEIRDSKSRGLLELLPYTLEIMTPSDAAMKAVIDFSKKTGDFAVLSLTDLKLIALVYTLESSVNGMEALVRRASNYKKVLDASKAVDNSVNKKVSNKFNSNTHNSDTMKVDDDNGLAYIENRVITSIIDDDDCGCGSVVTDQDNSTSSHIHSHFHNTTASTAAAATGIECESNLQMSILPDSAVAKVEGDDETEMDDDDCDNDDGDDDDDEDDEGMNDEDINDEDIEMDGDYDPEVIHEQSQLKELALTHTVISADTDNVNTIDHDKGVVSSVEFNLEEDFPSLSSQKPSSTATVSGSGTVGATISKKWNIIAGSAPIPGSLPRKIIPTIIPLSLHPDDINASSSTNIDGVRVISSINHFTGSTATIHSKTELSSNNTTTTTTTTTNTFNKPFQPSSSRILTGSSNSYTVNNANTLIADEDDDKGWINVGNISSFRANGLKMDSAPTSFVNQQDQNQSTNTSNNKIEKQVKKKYIAPVKVACITTDFSMQNVMFQLGLNLMSIEGMLIQKVKQWVLRCVSCFQIHYEMNRLFCSKCGGSVLTRVAVSIDKKTGKLRLHLKQNYQVNLRGTKYSLPLPSKAGKQDIGLLLREDQLLSGIWKQKFNAVKSQVKKTLGDQADMFSTGDVGFQSVKMSGGYGSGSGLAVGYGKKNPNAMKGRERRGKKRS